MNLPKLILEVLLMKRKTPKKILCVFFSFLFLFSTCAVSSYASGTGKAAASTAVSGTGKDFIITNPYASVNWNTWKAYKTQLHCHTNASDGYLTIKQFVQLNYDLGYDIVALTDHGTLNLGWNKTPQLVPLIRLVKYERTKLAPIVPLTDAEYNSYINGTAATTNGTVRQNGMLDVPLGIELNAATPVADCHLTGYFGNYGQGKIGVFGDYETPAAGEKAAGGLSMLAHVGEFVFLNKDWAAHAGQPVDNYYADKFARIFLDDAGSCVGMGVNSGDDSHTMNDRILYDQILQKTIPDGVVPWAYTFADAHDWPDFSRAYTMQLMPELTLSAFKTSMINGTFFSVSKYSDGVELNGMTELPAGYVTDNSLKAPMVTSVSVNQDKDTITITGTDFNQITWVSNGNVIARGMNCTTLSLNDFTNQIGCYVRFYITGPGGICYSQPFVINVKGVTMAPVTVPQTHDLSTFLRGLVTVLDKLVFQHSIIIKLFKKIAMGY